jgi:hypothetical protein
MGEFWDSRKPVLEKEESVDYISDSWHIWVKVRVKT